MAADFVFDVDSIDPPPVLFHEMRTPCACGRWLEERTYTFFPTAVFVHGTCAVCGPQSAIFAPHMRGVGEKLPEAIARLLGKLTADLARSHGEHPNTVLAAFLDYLATKERAAAVPNSTGANVESAA